MNIDEIELLQRGMTTLEKIQNEFAPSTFAAS